MAHDSCGDMRMGVKGTALAILALLADREPAFADFEEGRYDVDIETHASYNGREQGICLTLRKGWSGALLHVVFGEHRNSDDIFVDFWVTCRPFMNGPTLNDKPEEAYTRRHYIGGLMLGDAANYIYGLMEEFYKEGGAAFCRAHERMIDEVRDVKLSPDDFEATQGPAKGPKNELDI
jgi:hypothetical protein